MDQDERQKQQQRDDYTGWPVEVPAGPGAPETTGLGLDDDEGSSGSERLEALPTHENDQARGTSDTIGAGVMGVGGTAVEHGDPSEQPVPEEETEKDRTGMAGMPPGGAVGGHA
ncbi:hypothetical protein BH24CHL8_BH24CHL8_05760 [soil metagenome]